MRGGAAGGQALILTLTQTFTLSLNLDPNPDPNPSQAAKPAVQRQINPHDRLFVQMTARFAARPVWSRQALRASLGDEKFGDEKFKLTLPQLAYHFSNGPWRLCYIKYGYDPREHFDARIYQVMDHLP